ncbi:metallophosphoesterase 1 homolog isoform X1 [Argiope bruennichi]|uniref:metallophosphoesterase 1 homolog isoform X1 n=1 Tax=Argiope bruennichi TaxID=94029 RepID=UPI0024944398|nr:metallophosphoesterase 1 homolog isoform X1 [Argiope bruennichi]
MIVLFKKSRCTVKFTFLIILLVVIIVEWLEYSFTPLLFWPKLSHLFTSHNSIKLLIVGDPQLIGYRNSAPGLFGSIIRWDADKYVRKTFALAYNYVNPDIVVFLGDNLDEGEIATEEEFIIYFKRFCDIFKEVDFNKALIVPGDNDIGGEGAPPQPFFVKRFNRYFRDDVFIRYQFLEFIKINYITHSSSYRIAPNVSESSFRVVLSHIPLTPKYSSFVNRVIPYVQPHIILSAHDHKSLHIVAERKTGIIIQTPSMADLTSCSFNISDSTIHEIIAPTCSYRMGTNKMGYGVLIINKSGEVSYNVLWLPSRFRQLFILLFVLIIILMYLLFYILRCCLRKNNAVNHVYPYNLNKFYSPSSL